MSKPPQKQHTNIQISKHFKHFRPILGGLIQMGMIGFHLFSFHFMLSLRARVIASTLICTINLVLCQQKVMRLLQCKNFPTLIIINCMSCSLFWKCFLHLLPCKVMLWLRIILLFLFGKTCFPLKPTATITVVLSSPSGRPVNYFIQKPDSQQHNSRDSDKSPLTGQFKSSVLVGPIHKSWAEKLEFCIQ